MPMESEREVTVFVPENAYAAERSNCVAHEDNFKFLVLIQKLAKTQLRVVTS